MSFLPDEAAARTYKVRLLDDNASAVVAEEEGRTDVALEGRNGQVAVADTCQRREVPPFHLDMEDILDAYHVQVDSWTNAEVDTCHVEESCVEEEVFDIHPVRDKEAKEGL